MTITIPEWVLIGGAGYVLGVISMFVFIMWRINRSIA
jgi:hypothetical protein